MSKTLPVAIVVSCAVLVAVIVGLSGNHADPAPAAPVVSSESLTCGMGGCRYYFPKVSPAECAEKGGYWGQDIGCRQTNPPRFLCYSKREDHRTKE